MRKFTEEIIEVSKLESDPRFQRPINYKKLDDIKKNFDEDALNLITISRRNGGKGESLIIIDGQHRVRAVTELSDGAGIMMCRVFEGLTLVEEAALFGLLNNTSRPRLIDRFRASAVAEDLDAMEIIDILSHEGWRVDGQPANGNVSAVATLMRVHRHSKRLEVDPPLLQLAMRTITNAWGVDRDGAHASLVEGISAMYAEYGDQLKMDVLVGKLKSYGGGPSQLSEASSSLAKLKGIHVPMAVCEILVELYNRGRTTSALPAWRKRKAW